MLVKTWKNTNTFQKALFLFSVAIALRIVFLLNVGLIDDEAYHWSWAKELALSYFDHPGMVAWLEAVSTFLLGDTLLGVRLPSFLAYFGTMIVAWRLTWEMFDEFAAHFVVAMLLLTPLWGLGGYVASPEPFFMFLWVVAAWVFWQSCREDRKRWSTQKTWLWLGVVMGLGLNAKFPMALLAPGFGLYLLLTKERRKELLTPWPWVGALIASVICAPIFLWNYQADWPGFKYQFHERHAGHGVSPARWFAWWVTQVFFLSPFVYALAAVAFAKSVSSLKDSRWRFLFSLAIPTLLIFFVQPLFADYKPHWSGPGYLLMVIGAGYLWANGWSNEDRVYVKPYSRIWTGGIAVILIFINVLVYSTFVHPWVPKFHRFLANRGLTQAEWQTQWDFSNEFHGWEQLGELLNRRQREIHSESGRRPILAALRYETTAQVYWGAKQKTYYLSNAHAHYTVIQNQTHDLQNLKGQNALIVTTEKYPDTPMDTLKFDGCESEILRTFRGVEHSRTFTIWYCRNFQGLR